MVYDAAKVVNYFDKGMIKTPGFKIKAKVPTDNLTLPLTPNQSASQIDKPSRLKKVKTQKSAKKLNTRKAQIAQFKEKERPKTKSYSRDKLRK